MDISTFPRMAMHIISNDPTRFMDGAAKYPVSSIQTMVMLLSSHERQERFNSTMNELIN